jgi:hypothetical protein
MHAGDKSPSCPAPPICLSIPFVMKNPLLLVGAIIILALGAVSFAQWRAATSLQRQIAGLRAASASKADELARAQVEIEELRKKVADRQQVIVQLETRNKEIAASNPDGKGTVGEGAATEGEKGKEGFGEFGKAIGKMFSDPEMKKMVRSQQSMAINMMYGDLGKELGLAPDDAKQVMDILAERQMAMAEKGMQMFGKEKTDAASIEEAGKEVQANKAEYDAQLESILGKDGFAKLGEYERTVGDRMILQQYKQSLSAGGVPLSDQQSAGLMGIMKEERLKRPASPLDAGGQDFAGAMEAMRDEQRLEKILADQEAFNQGVLQRAPNVLTPDQMLQFENAQKQWLEMQKFGIKFMKGVAGQNAPSAPPAPPPQ